MAEEIVKARVWTKVDTLESWDANPLILGPGEFAPVLTATGGSVFNFKVGTGDRRFSDLPWSLQNPGAAQEADTSTVFPAGVPGLYIPTESGTYEGVTVDLSVGYVQLIWDGTTLVKVEFPINLAGYVADGDIGVTPGLNIADKSTFIDDSLVTMAGSQSSNTNYARTDFIKINPNMPLSFRRGFNIPIFGSFYEEANVGSHIENIEGVSGLTGFVGITPSNANYIRCNVSNNPATRQDDKDAFMLSYTYEPVNYRPYEEFVGSINNIPIKQPDYGGEPIINRWAGKRSVYTGDSIAAQSNNYILQALNSLGIVTVGNYAINGSTIARRDANPTQRDPIVDRYGDMTTDNIDLVIVSAGTNDCNYAFTPFGDFTDRVETTFLGALHVLCEGLQVMYPGKQLLFITPLKRFDNLPTPESTNSEGKTQKDYADAIKEVCAYWAIPVLDMFSESIINAFIPSHVTDFIPDGTHPNGSGRVVMARRLSGYLKQML